MAIDYGPALTLADIEPRRYCMICGAGKMQVRPNWRALDVHDILFSYEVAFRPGLQLGSEGL